MSKKKPKVPDQYYGVNDPAQLFDLVCWSNYCCGQFNGKIPVEQSREVYELIKYLIIKQSQKENK